MSREYDNYLVEHKGNVAKGFRWIQEDKFIEEVKTLLSGNIADQNTVDYLSLKIGRLHEEYLDRHLRLARMKED